jgi:hypothetical protein
MRCALAILLLVSALCSSALADEVENPRWLQRPNGEDFGQFYPRAALSQGVIGHALLDCSVRLDRTVACEVIEEAPTGWGFGAAAISISNSFRLEPAQRNGRPVEGGNVRVPLRFRFPRESPFKVEALPPDRRALFEAFQIPDLPMWEAAPNYEAVQAALPASVVEQQVRGRSVLSCRINGDRTLACEALMEVPAGQGFEQAALDLSHMFRIAESDIAFVERYRDRPFLLPVNFGAEPEQTPLNTVFAGVGPIVLPTVQVPYDYYPARAASVGIIGDVVISCSLVDARLACRTVEESPEGWDLADAMMAVLSSAGLDGPWAEYGLVGGNEVIFRFAFRPPAAAR